MPTETTATLLVGQSRPFFAGGVFTAEHLLVLNEGFRASWQVIPLDAAVARQELGDRRQTRPDRWLVGLPDAPQHLLAHALLAYLAVAAPATLAAHPEVDCFVRRDLRRSVLVSKVPDEAAAANIAEALPGGLQIVMTVLPGSTLNPLEASDLISTGTRVVSAVAEGVPA